MSRQLSPRALTLALAGASIMIYGGCGGDYYDEAGIAGAPPMPPPAEQTDDFEEFPENQFIEVSEEDTSTFSVDVNTASYTIMRRELMDDRLPEPNSVRAEEYINFFRFDYPEPVDAPFSLNLEVAPSYFGSTDERQRHLLRIGMKGKDVSLEEMKPTNLVFLIDVSGSMGADNKLPAAKAALHTLLDHLRPEDTVGIQTYASESHTLLEPTPVSERSQIESAIDSLHAEGATYGEGGIVDAYNMAESAQIDGGNNRVLIFTDGDFNVGKTGDELVDMVQSYRDRQISLTSVGFGRNGYGDQTMENLARRGSGNYFYVDSQAEAQRLFGEDLPSTIEVIAHDVRNQVQFDAEAVERYRLIGYEKRVMENEEFDDEDTDAAEIGPGHTVTAFYEVELAEEAEMADFLAEFRVRYKDQYGDETELIERQIKFNEVTDEFDAASADFRFAAAVAQFAAILRESQFVDDADFNAVFEVAEDAMSSGDEYQSEFLDLVNTADGLWEE